MSKEISNVTTTSAILGVVLAQLRNERHLTQEQIGKATGIGPTTWSRIEKGVSSLSMEQLRAAAKVLGVTPPFILERAEQLEQELRAKGILVGDVPPRDWAAATSAGGMAFATLKPYLPQLGAMAAPLLIPLASAALTRLIDRFLPEGEVKTAVGKAAPVEPDQDTTSHSSSER